MKIAVIVASYNRESLLKRCIESVLKQTYTNFNIYVVDDCSNVNINEIWRYFSDQRLIVSRMHQNSGANAVRNHAIDEAIVKGCDYVFILDDDDYLAAPDVFEELVSFAKSYQDFGWIVANVKGFSKQLPQQTVIQVAEPFDYISDYLMGKKIQGDKSHLISSKLIKNIRFSTLVRNGEEWTFFIEIASKTLCVACPILVKIVDYQDDGLSQVLKKSKNSSLGKIWLDTIKPLKSWFYRPLLRRACTRSLKGAIRLPVRVFLLAWYKLWSLWRIQ